MPRRAIALVVLVALVALAFACDDEANDGVDGDTSTPLPTTAVVPTEAPTEPGPAETATPVPGIRAEDLANRLEVLQFIASQGGEVDETAIIYADVTGDGEEEGIVPVSSGGTLGNIAIFAFGYTPDGLRQLLHEMPPREAREGHIRAEVDGGQLAVSWPIYGPDDANCCPSGGIRSRIYGWDGEALVLEDEIIGMP